MAKRGGRLKVSAFHGYGRQGFSTKSGGKLSHKGKFLTRRQKYGEVRRGLGLSGG